MPKYLERINSSYTPKAPKTGVVKKKKKTLSGVDATAAKRAAMSKAKAKNMPIKGQSIGNKYKNSEIPQGRAAEKTSLPRKLKNY